MIFILAGNEDMHESLDEFEFRQDPTTDYGVRCPWASEKSMYNVVNTLAPSFLFESSSFMQVLKEEKYYISDEFEIRQDSTPYCGVSCPQAFEKISIDL